MGGFLSGKDDYCPKCGIKLTTTCMDSDVYQGLAELDQIKIKTALYNGEDISSMYEEAQIALQQYYEERSRKKAMQEKSLITIKIDKKTAIFIVAATLIIALIGIVYTNVPRYTCSRCGKTVTKAYYDPWDSDSYFCEDCARDYYAPFPIESYRVH